MQFHILDENSNPVAIMDNTLSEAIHFKNSKFQGFATGSANFFDFETDKLHPDSKMFQVGYWIVFKHRGRDQKLYINNIEEAEKDTLMQISAKSSNLDLNNEKIAPPAPDTAKSIEWYFNIILNDTGYTIGINELSNLTRKLSWDSEEMTRRALLQSVATQFDNGELEYEEILNSDFTTKERLVHIKKQVGEVRDDIELEYGKNIKTIKRTTNIDNMCTAVKPTTTDKDGKVTTIANEPDWEVLDDDGNIKFYHKKGEAYIFAPIANARFGNRGTNVNGGGYIVREINYDNISSSEAFTRGKIYIEEYSVPEISYETEGRTEANPGDTVTIIDNGYNPPLYLSARVLDVTDSFDDPTLEGANFGNYKALESQISSDLQSKMAALAERNAPYKTTTLTTNGVQFKNSEGSTVLTARLYKGTNETIPDSYNWFFNEDTLSETSNQLTVDASDVDEKAVIRWNAIINNKIVASDEVTITNVSDGENGETPTITINDDTSVTFKTSEQTETTPILKGKDGDKGSSGIILSDTAPVNPEVDQLWQNTSSTPEIVKKWDGSDWVMWGLYAPNINVDTLSALAISTGSLTNVYETDHVVYGKHNGTIKISDDGFKIEDIMTLTGGKFKGTKVDITGSTQGITGVFMQEIPDITDTTKFKQVWYTADGIYFTDGVSGKASTLTAETMYDSGWVPLTVRNGSGKIFVRKWLGRKLIMLQDYVFNGTYGNYGCAVLPTDFLPTVDYMQKVPAWATNGSEDTFQIVFTPDGTTRPIGTILKITNNAGNIKYSTVIEYY